MALASNISMWFYLIYLYWKGKIGKDKYETIYKQLFNMTIIKFLPYYLIGGTKIYERDILFNFGIVILYTIILGLNDTNPIEMYKRICKSMKENKDELPMYVLYSKIGQIHQIK